MSENDGPPSRQPVLSDVRRRPAVRSPEPPWASVIATTVRLWARRRLTRKRWVLGLVIIGLALTVASALSVMTPRHPAATAREVRKASNSGGGGAVGAATAIEPATLRHEAAAWVATQVRRDAIVACDPAMCPALQAQGFPAANLLVLRPATTDPLGSDIVVATAAVRSELGGRLPGVYAPAVIASFRSGSQRIDIRAVAPHGAAAYWAALRSDQQARRIAGAKLLRNPLVAISKAARRQLAAGRVDSRLLITLNALAARHRMRIVSFGTAVPGASSGIPLRSAEISPGGPRPVDGGATALRSALAFLRAQRPPYVPGHLRHVTLAGGRPALWIEFGAPSQLGLLASPAMR
ncbi:MAG: hypothetical protein ACM3ML_29105 [Micromonosporaceae bacterium]